MTNRIDDQLAELAARQHGVLTRAQLTVAGMSRGQVDANLAADRWQRVGRGVVLAHNGPLTPPQVLTAALLQCPEASAVSGPTAAMLDGYRIADPAITIDDTVFITAPCGFRRPAGIGAQIRWSRHLSDVDVHPAREPRRTRLERSVLDWAAWQPRAEDRAVRAIVLGAVQQRLTTPDQLRDFLIRRARCRHLRLIVESIDDAEGGAASVPEREFTQIVRRLGLPKPTRQVLRCRPNGRAYLDVAWEQYRYAAEIMGAHHFRPGSSDLDLMRMNDLVIGGDRVLQFSSFAVRRRADLVGDCLVRALRSAGWVG